MKSTLLNLLWSSAILASSGDKSPVFQSCVSRCVESCDEISIPLHLKISLWDCTSTCQYDCMTTLSASGKIHQYYGKWPFTRLFGLQEPASVLFSILNGYGHYSCSSKFFARISSDYPLLILYQIQAYLAMFVWACSALYHSRDFGVTEKLDYFSAMAYLLSGCFLAFVKLRGSTTLQLQSESGVRRSPRRRHSDDQIQKPVFTRHHALTALGLAAFFMYHISYLSFYKFDYGYNMRASLAIGMTVNLMWLTWAYQYKTSRPHAIKIVRVVLLMTLALALEIFDFPPLFGVLDAHSLWHLGTVPVVYLYWDFLTVDALWEVKHVYHSEMIL